MALLQALTRQANRSDYLTVEAIKSHISSTKPHRFASITARLCVYTVSEFPRGTHIELIDAEAGDNFAAFSDLLNGLTDHERIAVTFRVTVWSPIDTVNLVPGTVVRIQHIDHLTLWDGISAQGWVNIRHLPAPAIPTPQPPNTNENPPHQNQPPTEQPNNSGQTPPNPTTPAPANPDLGHP